MESAIVIRKLSKAFGRRSVLSGVDLDIPKGAITAIMGLSGTG